jgi:uncharacterized protein (DUF58 family)
VRWRSCAAALRAARGPARPGARRAAPPPHAQLRGTGRGLDGRRADRARGQGPAAARRAAWPTTARWPMPDPPRPRRAALRGAAATARMDGAASASTALLQGDYRTLFRGAWLDLADLREYQLHDDVRHIDWNVTARLQIPHVREFLEDREVTAWFLLDLSASVDFGSRAPQARGERRLRRRLASLVLRHGNRVGAVLYGRPDAPPWCQRGSGRLQVHAACCSACASAPRRRRGRRRHAPGRPARPGPPVDAAPQHGVRGVDFISEAGWEAPLSRLAQRHDVVAVRLYDPLEMTLPEHRPAADAGRRDRRAAARGHRRARLSGPLRGRGAAQHEAELRSANRARRRGHAGAGHRRRPAARCCAPGTRRTRVGSAAAWRPAPLPLTRRLA